MKNITTQQLTLNAMLAAVCAVLGYMALDLFTLKVTFESFPVLLAGLMFGPVHGALVGFIGTFIYQLLRYGLEMSTPLWIIPYVIMGAVVGAFAKRSTYDNSTKEIRAIALAAELLIFALNTVALFFYSKLLYGAFSLPFITGSLIPRFLIAAAKGVVYGLIARPILIKLSRITHNGGR